MKKEVCQYKRDHPKAKYADLGKHFTNKWGVSIGRSTYSDILRNRDKWIAISTNLEDRVHIRVGVHKYKDMEEMVHGWLRECVRQNKLVTPKIMRRKAKQIGDQLNITGLSYSLGWLSKFRKRFHITSYKTGGAENGLTCDLEEHVNIGQPAAQKDDLLLPDQADILPKVDDLLPDSDTFDDNVVKVCDYNYRNLLLKLQYVNTFSRLWCWMICIWHCFECEMGLSQHKSPKSFTSL